MAALLALAWALRGTRRPRWLRGRGDAARPSVRPDVLEVLRKYWPGREREHRGMQSLSQLLRRIAPAERLPMSLFCFPIAINWLRLSLRYRSLTLPTLADPLIEMGDF